MELRICKIHGLVDFKRKLKKGKKGQIYQSYQCRPCSVKRQSDIRHSNRFRLSYLFGGKCCLCGYNECISAFNYHHVNDKEKEFEITDKLSGTWDNLLKEARKCILVCSNCHSKIHDKLVPYPIIKHMHEKFMVIVDKEMEFLCLTNSPQNSIIESTICGLPVELEANT